MLSENKNTWESIPSLDEQSVRLEMHRRRLEKGLSLILCGYRLKERFRRDTNMTILGEYGSESECVLDEFLSYTAKKVTEGLLIGPFTGGTRRHANTISDFFWDTFTECNEPTLHTEYEKKSYMLHRMSFGLDPEQISVHVINFFGREMSRKQPWSHVHIDVEDQSYDFLICRESIMQIPMYMLIHSVTP